MLTFIYNFYKSTVEFVKDEINYFLSDKPTDDPRGHQVRPRPRQAHLQDDRGDHRRLQLPRPLIEPRVQEGTEDHLYPHLAFDFIYYFSILTRILRTLKLTF